MLIDMLIAENKHPSWRHPSSRMGPVGAPIKRLLRQRRAFKTSIVERRVYKSSNNTTSSLPYADPHDPNVDVPTLNFETLIAQKVDCVQNVDAAHEKSTAGPKVPKYFNPLWVRRG